MDQMLVLFLLRHTHVLFEQPHVHPVELEHCTARYSRQNWPFSQNSPQTMNFQLKPHTPEATNGSNACIVPS